MGTYLYLYVNEDEQKLYVGIGDETSRIWEGHNNDATSLRDLPATHVLQTPKPFSTREDARQAEAIAIFLAARSHWDVDADDKELLASVQRTVATNISGVVSTSHLVPAVLRREGTVHYDGLIGTAIVVLKPDAIDDRPTLHAGRTAATFIDRATRIWPLATAANRKYKVRRLLAVLKTSHVVLGDWDLDPDGPIEGSSFVLANELDDTRSIKGMVLELDGARLGNKVTWSSDIRTESLQ